MQKVTILLNGNRAYIKFRYNPDVVDILKEFRGRWSPKDKMWTLNVETAKKLYRELKKQHYLVSMVRI